MNRRTLLSVLGSAPAVVTAAGNEHLVDPELLAKKLSAESYQKVKADSECGCQTCADLKWIKAHTRFYSPELGDVGRGEVLPAQKIAELMPLLCDLGFAPFEVFSPAAPEGLTGRYLPVFPRTPSTTPFTADLWFGFTRAHKGCHEIIAFELSRGEAEDFHQAIGWSL